MSNHIHFIPCQSALPFLIYIYFKTSSWKSKIMVLGEVNIHSQTSYWLVPILSRFLVNRLSRSRYATISKFDLERVMGPGQWVRLKAQDHVVGPNSFRLTSLSFLAIRFSHSREKAISKFHLEKPGQTGPDILLTQAPFIQCQLTLWFLRYGYFKIWPWKGSPYQGRTVDPTSHTFRSMSIRPPIPENGYFIIWHWKSKFKVS